jgi:hypothetical protein
MRDDSLPLPPPTGPAQTHDEIAAEIADHLATAEAALTKSGSAPEEARSAARKNFGDVEKIQKTCYWIQNGETIMLRWTLIVLASVLCVLLGLSVLGNWRTQSQLADEMGKLSAELKALAAAKETPPPAPQPPEITGTIYAGSKDKPLSGASVAVLKADSTVVRRVICDKAGVYRSGPLQPGDYCVTSPIIGAPQKISAWDVQSEPVYLHQGSGTVTQNLDPVYHCGGIKIVASRPLPEVLQEGKYLIKSRIETAVKPFRRRQTLWTPAQSSPPAWPIYCNPVNPGISEARGRGGSPSDRVQSAYSVFTLSKERIGIVQEYTEQNDARFPVGKTDIAVSLYLTVLPVDDKGDVLLSQQRVRDVPHLRGLIPADDVKRFYPFPWFKLEDKSVWHLISDGQPWLEHIAGAKPYSRSGPELPPQQSIEIREGQFTTLYVEIPEGVEREIQKAIEEATEVQKFADLVNGGLLQRRLKVAEIRYEPMAQ